ncbi:riboflavin kinase [Rhodococcus koreensis]|uniref:riboflavin kinase n=1 Tax=Rhodococcus koreensis TaxID=99653 RepID=UPI00366BAF55
MTNVTDTRTVTGPVIHGDQRGRELGFPTANVVLNDATAVDLRDGVWAGSCDVADGRVIPAAISIGRRPTFYGRVGPRLLEAHLLDFQGDLYDKIVTVRLEHWIRAQAEFSSKDELIDALTADVERVRDLAASETPR